LKSLRAFALCVTTSLVLVLPTAASAQAPGSDKSGGAAYQEPTPTPTPPPAPQDITVPGAVAQLLPDGTAAAPADAPPQVQQAIFAANKIQAMPYVYGGGHGDFEDDGYDCSGTVSYALHGAGLLDSPLDSGSFMRWGEAGPGTWITVFTNPGHAYAVIAGLRLDTSAAAVTRTNSR
jgi:cell wall-associated NlpC family hydrolase